MHQCEVLWHAHTADRTATVRERQWINSCASAFIPLTDRASLKMRDQLQTADERKPIAYFITFRCYGTWLHGDERESVDPSHNSWGEPRLLPNPARESSARNRQSQQQVLLTSAMRQVVDTAIREMCNYRLHEINARSNHVHFVITADRDPEFVMNSAKSYATRALNDRKLISKGTKPWARHGSTVYLWDEDELLRACEYVRNQWREP